MKRREGRKNSQFRPDIGKNEAIRPGAGPHRSIKREKDRLRHEIDEELDILRELTHDSEAFRSS